MIILRQFNYGKNSFIVLVPDGVAPFNPVCPPMYYDLFERDSSLGTPPSYKSNTSSLENSSADLLASNPPPPPPPPPTTMTMTTTTTTTVAPPVKPTKLKKGKKKCVPPAPETIPEAKE